MILNVLPGFEGCMNETSTYSCVPGLSPLNIVYEVHQAVVESMVHSFSRHKRSLVWANHRLSILLLMGMELFLLQYYCKRRYYGHSFPCFFHSLLLGVSLGMELLDHRESICSALAVATQQLSKVVLSIYTLSSREWELQLPVPFLVQLKNLVLSGFFQ